MFKRRPNVPTEYAPLTDPMQILDDMRFANEERKFDDGDGEFVARGRAQQMTDENLIENQRAHQFGIPTMWGSIMQRRKGGIQGRGVAGALGKSINPAAGTPALQQYENEALQEHYPLADLFNRFRGRR